MTPTGQMLLYKRAQNPEANCHKRTVDVLNCDYCKAISQAYADKEEHEDNEIRDT